MINSIFYFQLLWIHRHQKVCKAVSNVRLRMFSIVECCNANQVLCEFYNIFRSTSDLCLPTSLTDTDGKRRERLKREASQRTLSSRSSRSRLENSRDSCSSKAVRTSFQHLQSFSLLHPLLSNMQSWYIMCSRHSLVNIHKKHPYTYLHNIYIYSSYVTH